MLLDMRKTIFLLTLTVTAMICLALLVAVDKLAPGFGYGAIMFLGALWHSQDAEACVLALAQAVPLLVPKDRAEGAYPISEVKDVAAK
jgi:hypothetical protein